MKRPSPKRAMQMANVKLFKKIKEGVQWHFRKYSLARMQKAESKGGRWSLEGRWRRDQAQEIRVVGHKGK